MATWLVVTLAVLGWMVLNGGGVALIVWMRQRDRRRRMRVVESHGRPRLPL